MRRADVVELLADVGLGPGAGAVVSQGRVETILSSSPADRRALVEEAAGLGRFKRRRHRAELKLARVEIQVERARDLEREVQKRLRPLALQATAAERAEKLAVEVRRLRAGIATADLAELGDRVAEAKARRARCDATRAEIDARLEQLLGEREQAEERLAAVAGGNEGAATALYRIQSARERVEMRREAAADLLERLRTPVVRDPGDELREQARLAEGRATAVERALSEREGLPPAARALAEQGERLALSLVDVAPGRERAVTAALGHRAAAVVAASTVEGLALLEQARAAGLGSLVVLVGREPGRARLVDARRPARRAARVAGARRHRRGLRLRPGPRRAVVRRRDGRGVPDRARGPGATPPRRGADARGEGRERDSGRPSRRMRASSRSANGSAIRSPRPSRRLRGSSARSRPRPRAAALRRPRSQPPSASSQRRRPSSGARLTRRRPPSRRSTSSSPGSTPRPRTHDGGSRRRRRSLRKAVAKSSRRRSSGSSAGARRSAASIRSRRRSTSARRRTSRSCARRRPTSRRASPSSRRCAAS